MNKNLLINYLSLIISILTLIVLAYFIKSNLIIQNETNKINQSITKLEHDGKKLNNDSKEAIEKASLLKSEINEFKNK